MNVITYPAESQGARRSTKLRVDDKMGGYHINTPMDQSVKSTTHNYQMASELHFVMDRETMNFGKVPSIPKQSSEIINPETITSNR